MVANMWLTPQILEKGKMSNLYVGPVVLDSADSHNQFLTSFMIFGPLIVEKLQSRYLTLKDDIIF